ncbi:hypothetical protein LguiA_003626 [Lonicera macranthoides]
MFPIYDSIVFPIYDSIGGDSCLLFSDIFQNYHQQGAGAGARKQVQEGKEARSSLQFLRLPIIHVSYSYGTDFSVLTLSLTGADGTILFQAYGFSDGIMDDFALQLFMSYYTCMYAPLMVLMVLFYFKLTALLSIFIYSLFSDPPLYSQSIPHPHSLCLSSLPLSVLTPHSHFRQSLLPSLSLNYSLFLLSPSMRLTLSSLCPSSLCPPGSTAAPAHCCSAAAASCLLLGYCFPETGAAFTDPSYWSEFEGYDEDYELVPALI